MTKITLNVDNIKDLQIIKELARRLNIEILEEKESPLSSKEGNAVMWLNKIAEEGDLKKQIGNPVFWQRNMRAENVNYNQ